MRATARYTLTLPEGPTERQASSGLIVSTGTGATGWCRSAWLERESTLVLPAPTERRLAWFVREAWPSPSTGTTLTEGDLTSGQTLTVTAESDQLVLFGDGIETDATPLAWGKAASIHLAAGCSGCLLNPRPPSRLDRYGDLGHVIRGTQRGLIPGLSSNLGD